MEIRAIPNGLQDSVTSMPLSQTLLLHLILITNLYRRVDIITNERQTEINIHTHSHNESMRSVPELVSEIQRASISSRTYNLISRLYL